MELILLGMFMLAAFFFGNKAGKGEDIELLPKYFKPIIRTEEEEAKLVEQMRKKK